MNRPNFASRNHARRAFAASGDSGSKATEREAGWVAGGGGGAGGGVGADVMVGMLAAPRVPATDFPFSSKRDREGGEAQRWRAGLRTSAAARRGVNVGDGFRAGKFFD